METSVYSSTDCRHSREFPGGGAAKKWYACYTRSRHEKQVCHRLNLGGVESFLPMLHRERQWHDRRNLVEWPLFPSYVFARCASTELHRVVATLGVVTIVSANGRATAIDEEEIVNVQRFVTALADSGQTADSQPLIDAGQRARIRSGPFAGVECVVIRSRGRHRVLVGLRAIGQGWEIEIDASLLELMPDLEVTRVA